MRVLFADRISPSAIARLRELGHAVDESPDLAGRDLPGAISGYEVLVVRSTPVTAATVDASDDLALIVRAGAGTNTIDADAATRRGIYVSNVPGRSAAAVAELTMSLILAIDRSIPESVVELRNGRWDKTRFSQADGLYGRQLGIVGLGEIGLAVAERAAAFGMKLLAIDQLDRSPDVLDRAESVPIEMVSDLRVIAERADVVSFHLPATESTRRIIGAGFLERLRPGAIVINTSRGELVDSEALIAAMDNKGIRVGLDVYPDEPEEGQSEFRSQLTEHPNVYGTHHIGASTRQAQEAISDEVVRIVELFEQGTVLNCVNLADQLLGTTTLSVRHHDEVGVLSDVFAVLRAANINVEQMENRVFSGARAAVATIHVTGEVTPEILAELEAIKPVINVSMTEKASG